MKYAKTIIALFTGILILTSSQSATEETWWEKAISIFKKKEKQENIQTPSIDEISTAFKDALRIGSGNVVSQLGRTDGFNADPAIHIPLPGELNSVRRILGKVGMSKLIDDLELKLNRAAEAATPKAKKLFIESINDLTFDDVRQIYQGPEDSATKYFKAKMSKPLSAEMRPIIENSLSEVGAIQAYDNVIGKYKGVPFVPDVKADLTSHVIDKGLDGIFYYLKKEEAAIRKNPVRQTTELLKKVFGAR